MTAPVLLSHLKGNRNTITSIVFNDNEQFAASSLDKTIGIYSLKNKNTRCLRFEMPFEVYDMDWSVKNIFAAVGNSKIANICEAVLHKGYSEQIAAHQNSIRSVHFSTSGNRIITGSDDKSIKMFRLSHRNFISSFTGHTNWIHCARFSPNNKMIASCAEDKTMKVFDVQSGQLIHSFKDEKGYGNQLVWHKDNNTIAIAQENHRLKIYDLKQRKLIQYYRIYDCAVNSLDFHPSGYFMLTGDNKGSTKILDLLEGRDIFTIYGHQDAVTAVRFSKDGDYFATGSKDRHLMVFKSNIEAMDFNETGSSIEEITNQDPDIDNKENQKDDKKSIIVDSRKSVHYNYLNNDSVNV